MQCVCGCRTLLVWMRAGVRGGPGSQGWRTSSCAWGDLEQVPELLCEMQTSPSEEDVVKQGLGHVTCGPSLEVTRGAGGALGMVAGGQAGHFLFCFHFSTCTEKARQRSGCPLPSPGLISSSGKWRYWQYLPPRMPVRTGWGKCVISPSQHRAVRTQQAPAVVWPPLFLLLLWISFKWFRTDR